MERAAEARQTNRSGQAERRKRGRGRERERQSLTSASRELELDLGTGGSLPTACTRWQDGPTTVMMMVNTERARRPPSTAKVGSF